MPAWFEVQVVDVTFHDSKKLPRQKIRGTEGKVIHIYTLNPCEHRKKSSAKAPEPI